MAKGFFIDVQGTLICDEKKEPIAGACEFIDALNKRNIPYVVITNNTKVQSDEFLKSLQKKGLNIKNYIDPFSLLTSQLNEKKIAAFGSREFLDIMKNLGYELDYENPNALVVSIKKEYTNEDYALMIECALKAQNIIGMHETSIYSKEGKRYPGVGAIMQMIKFATNKEYNVVGKPSFNFYDKAREMLRLTFEDITIISDDMIGDLIGAGKLNMKTALVLSGKIRDENEVLPTLKKEQYPTYIGQNMNSMLERLNKGEI
ncbi:MAG: HAD family hydrolase [Deltaproteobacteria bacterium HGW-Deltaproteobacteria-24]|nr:MAG: HAD family hydrolase [Deltaproteobacteria bacterium HGW-Deltaproteobacteria-24]